MHWELHRFLQRIACLGVACLGVDSLLNLVPRFSSLIKIHADTNQYKHCCRYPQNKPFYFCAFFVLILIFEISQSTWSRIFWSTDRKIVGIYLQYIKNYPVFPRAVNNRLQQTFQRNWPVNFRVSFKSVKVTDLSLISQLFFHKKSGSFEWMILRLRRWMSH